MREYCTLFTFYSLRLSPGTYLTEVQHFAECNRQFQEGSLQLGWKGWRDRDGSRYPKLDSVPKPLWHILKTLTVFLSHTDRVVVRFTCPLIFWYCTITMKIHSRSHQHSYWYLLHSQKTSPALFAMSVPGPSENLN